MKSLRLVCRVCASGLVLACGLATVPLSCEAAIVAPLFAQGGAALVQPGGLQGLANPQNRPEMVQAEPQPEQPPPAEAEPAAATTASPFEIRYLISYLLMLVFVGGGTALVIRPNGRVPPAEGKASTPSKPAAKK